MKRILGYLLLAVCAIPLILAVPFLFVIGGAGEWWREIWSGSGRGSGRADWREW
jgi:hypothetical protein